MLCSRPPQAGHLKPSGHRDATITARHCSSLPYYRSNAGSLSPFWNCTALRAISIPPPKALVCSWFVPYPGRLSKVRNQVILRAWRRAKLRLRPQGDSVLRVGIGVSAIHALGDGRWRPGMSGSDGARGADLWEVFSVVPDHRRAEGKRYPLAGLLMVALAAMLAGRSDQLGIVRWGRKLSREALAELGILRGRVPAPSVWSELFRALDVGALERLLGAWVKGAGAAGHVAIDGKRLRGSAVGDVPGVHLLAAFSERLQGVIGPWRVAPEANEITAALTLLKTLPIEGAIISGDAIFAQTDLCRLIIERGGDYLFTVKSNQPTLEADIALAFRPDSPLCGVGARA